MCECEGGDHVGACVMMVGWGFLARKSRICYNVGIIERMANV